MDRRKFIKQGASLCWDLWLHLRLVLLLAFPGNSRP